MQCESCDVEQKEFNLKQCLNCYELCCPKCWNTKGDPDFCKECYEEINK